jgi:alpha-amylase
LEVEVDVGNRGPGPIDADLAIEWSVCLSGGGGNPAAWLEINGTRTPHDARRTASGQTEMAQGNDQIGVAIASKVSPAAEVWCAPVETISNSEAGFERVYQGAGFLFSWPLALAAGESRTVGVTHYVTTARDRAIEEAAASIPAAAPAVR